MRIIIMLSIVVNLSLVGVFLAIGEYIARKAKAVPPESRSHLKRVSRGVSLFSIVAALQLCEALAPEVMGAGEVGLLILSLEALGISVGLWMILVGMSRWSVRGRTNKSQQIALDDMSATATDIDDFRLAYRAVRSILTATAKQCAFTDLMNKLCVLVAELTRSRSVSIDQIGSDGRRKRIAALNSTSAAGPASDLENPSIPEEWRTTRIHLEGVGSQIEIGWDGSDYGPVEKEALEAACDCVRSELLRRLAERSAGLATRMQDVQGRVTEVALAAGASSEKVSPSQLWENLFGLFREKVGRQLGCDVVILDWYSESASEIRSLWQTVYGSAPTRGFLPLTHRFPLPLTYEQPFASSGRLPRFDSRPGGGRLTRLGLRSLATAGFFDKNQELRAQISFGYRRAKQLTGEEKSLISHSVKACTGLIALVEARSPGGANVSEQAIKLPQSGSLESGSRISLQALEAEETFL